MGLFGSKKEPKVDEKSSAMGLEALAEAFGVDDLSPLLALAMEGRVYLDGGKAVFKLSAPIKLENGQEVSLIKMRMPTQGDYEDYAKGMKVIVRKEGAEVDDVMQEKRNSAAVSMLAEIPLGVVRRISRIDFRKLTGVCEALGFFD